MPFFKVKAKCGHVRRSNYIIIDFPVIANDGKEAAEVVRQLPRVKHDQKDAILDVKKIDLNEYKKLFENNKNDGYLKCKNKQEQNALDLTHRIFKEKIEDDISDEEKEYFYYKGKKVRLNGINIKNIFNENYY